ncbi:MAG: hypothetical protein ACFFDN_14620 [Candidatus Hodarchaeota archaeon]
MRIQNKRFNTQLKKFIIEALKVLKEESKKTKIRKRQEDDIVWKENGYSIKLRQEYNFEPILLKSYKHISSLRETKLLLNMIEKNQPIIECCPNISRNNKREIKNSDCAQGFYFSHIYGLFISRMLQSTQSLEFNQNIFDSLYSEFEEFIYGKYDKFKVLVPLINFYSDIENINIGNNIYITKISEQELRELWEISWGINIPRNHLNKIGWWISFIVKKEKQTNTIFSNPPHDVNNTVEQIITTLRLFKIGLLGINFIYKIPLGWRKGSLHSSPTDIDTISVPVDLSAPIYNGKDFRLFKKEIQKFQLFQSNIRNALKTMSKHTQISVRRFNMAYERNRPLDKLIDYWISLEALFGDSEGEMSYKVPLRATCFIRESFDTFKDLKEWYAIRSYIVHGGIRNKRKEKAYLKKINQDIKTLESYVRKCLVQYLCGSFSSMEKKYVINEIDKSTINNKKKSVLL